MYYASPPLFGLSLECLFFFKVITHALVVKLKFTEKYNTTIKRQNDSCVYDNVRFKYYSISDTSRYFHVFDTTRHIRVKLILDACAK